jgi:N-acetylglucosamine kinase-like BadF-type ATPase
LRTPRFIIGVDGGGTKTVALVATTAGKVLGRGEAGPSNYHNVGPIAASRAIKESVIRAKKQARLAGTKADIAVVALAAINSDRDRTAAERFVRRSGIARKNLVVHDSRAALYAATGGRPGIIVIAGTGCVAAGINKAGKYSRVSGWGYLVDDEGSAYDVGRKALMSAFRSIDSRAPKTRLVSVLRRRFRVNALEDALGIIYSQGFGAQDVASLAIDVARTARTDIVSRRILNNAGLALADAACAVATNLGMENESFIIALVGGTFKAGRHVINSFRKRIKQDCPCAEIELLQIEPARGALMLAVQAHRQLASG